MHLRLHAGGARSRIRSVPMAAAPSRIRIQGPAYTPARPFDGITEVSTRACVLTSSACIRSLESP